MFQDLENHKLAMSPTKSIMNVTYTWKPAQVHDEDTSNRPMILVYREYISRIYGHIWPIIYGHVWPYIWPYIVIYMDMYSHIYMEIYF